MRSHLSRHLSALTAASIILLGTTGVLISTANGLLGVSTACGCESKTVHIELGGSLKFSASPETHTFKIKNLNPIEERFVEEVRTN